MVKSAVLGYPRVGVNRAVKKVSHTVLVVVGAEAPIRAELD